MHSTSAPSIPRNYFWNTVIEKLKLPLYCDYKYQVQSKRAYWHKVFLRPFFTTNKQANRNACDVAYAYITENLMTELQQLNNVAGQWNNTSEGDQSEDEDSNFEDEIPDLDGINRIPEGEPLVINDSVFNMDEEIS